MPDKSNKFCNFCGKSEDKVQSIFTAGTSNICDECVVYCYELLMGPLAKVKPSKKSNDRARKIRRTVWSLIFLHRLK